VNDWIELLERAEGKRKEWKFPPDAIFRLVDGAGDGADGVFIDVFAGRWLVSTVAERLPDGLAAALASRGRPVWWRHLDRHEKTGPQALGEAAAAADDPFLAGEDGLACEISFRRGYSPGWFHDQRENRREMGARIRPGDRVLNLFSYTGAFSLRAAAAGAVTTSVDASGAFLEWGKRNLVHNGIAPGGHHFVRGDAVDWVAAFARKKLAFDGIVIDPPTFGRVRGRREWRLERDLPGLLAAAAGLLAPGGWLLATANTRRLDPWDFRAMIEAAGRAAGRALVARPARMPPDFTGPAYLHGWWLDSTCGRGGGGPS
jgi:23S rRNA (cytosine1962-C5)-methyltransferase